MAGNMVKNEVICLSLDQAEYRYRQGMISQDEWEAFTHVWATSRPRFGGPYYNWTEPPTDPNVISLVNEYKGYLV